MTLKLEEMFNEIQVAGSLTTDLPIVTTSSITAASQSTTGSFAVVNDLTVGDSLAVTGAAGFNGAVSINAGLTATGTIAGAIGQFSGALGASGAAVFAAGVTVTGIVDAGELSVGNAGIKVGSLSGNLNPTGTTGGIGCLFVNSSAGATGVTNRIYINTNGETAWTFIQTGA